MRSRSLKLRILLLFTLLFLGANLFTFVLVRRVTGIRYSRYIKNADIEQARSIASVLGGNWETEEIELRQFRPQGMMRMGPHMMGRAEKEIFILDREDKLIYSSPWGAVPRSEKLDHSAPILSRGETVGYVLVGAMGGPALRGPERNFLKSLNRIYIISSISFTLLGILFALMIINRLLNPLEKIRLATRELGKGNLSARTGIEGRDEIADLARSFDRMAASLEESRKWKVQLMSDTAHELRTPVSLIMGTLEMIREGIYSASPDKMDQLHREAESLARLIGDMQTLSSLEGKLPEMEMEELDPRGFLEETLEAFQPLMKAKSLKFHLELPEISPPIGADPLRLRQVLKNLISNGIRYSPVEGELLLRLEINKGYLVFHLEDQGPGIAPENRRQIFERFFRVEDSRNRQEGGRGLGLAISKAMIEAMSGSIGAGESRWGGADLWFSLPLLC